MLPSVSIEQLFDPGLYAELRASLFEVVATLKEAERCAFQGVEPAAVPARLPEVYALRLRS